MLMSQHDSLTAETGNTDAKAFIAYLDSQAAVDKKRKIGTTGYCMGGPLVFQTAAASPARVGAGATFHGGGLVTKDADSPHTVIAGTTAAYAFGHADKAFQTLNQLLRSRSIAYSTGTHSRPLTSLRARSSVELGETALPLRAVGE